MLPTTTEKKVQTIQCNVAGVANFDYDSLRNSFTVPTGHVFVLLSVRFERVGPVGVDEPARRQPFDRFVVTFVHSRDSC